MNNKLENFIQSHLEKREKQKPDPAVLERVLDEMKLHRSDVSRQGILRPFTSWKWAAASLFFVVSFLGIRYFIHTEPAKEVFNVNTKPGKKDLPLPSTNSTVHDILGSAEIKDQIIAKTFDDKPEVKPKKMVSGFNNIESVASRINAVASVSSAISNNNVVIDTLIGVLNNDPNANVRLAAVDGLARFYDDSYAIKKISASLKTQSDPVIQINLITLLVCRRDVSVLPDLERMIKDEKLEKSVKDIAYSGILKLSPELLN